jgi:hypothetical protein
VNYTAGENHSVKNVKNWVLLPLVTLQVMLWRVIEKMIMEIQVLNRAVRVKIQVRGFAKVLHIFV